MQRLKKLVFTQVTILLHAIKYSRAKTFATLGFIRERLNDYFRRRETERRRGVCFIGRY